MTCTASLSVLYTRYNRRQVSRIYSQRRNYWHQRTCWKRRRLNSMRFVTQRVVSSQDCKTKHFRCFVQTLRTGKPGQNLAIIQMSHMNKVQLQLINLMIKFSDSHRDTYRSDCCNSIINYNDHQTFTIRYSVTFPSFEQHSQINPT